MRKIITMILLIGMMAFSFTMKTNADTDVVKIDEVNFPDEGFRWYVNTLADVNKDQVLQQSEIDRLERISINYNTEGGVAIAAPKVGKINCKGIEYFTNLKDLELSPLDGENSNIECINNLTKLEKICITGEVGKKIKYKWDFTRFPNLKEITTSGYGLTDIIDFTKCLELKKVDLYKVNKVKKFKLGKSIEDFELTYVTSDATLDFSKCKQLKRLDLGATNIKKIKFGKLANLIDLKISNEGGKSNRTLKKLDLSGLKTVDFILLNNLSKLKNVKLGKKDYLRVLSIDYCKAIKTLDISKCKNIKTVGLDKSELRTIKVTKKQKDKFSGLYKETNFVTE